MTGVFALKFEEFETAVHPWASKVMRNLFMPAFSSENFADAKLFSAVALGLACCMSIIHIYQHQQHLSLTGSSHEDKSSLC